MKNNLYDMIFKRKSFHIFRDVKEKLTKDELEQIRTKAQTLTPLFPDIKTEIKIVPSHKTTCKRGQEYCILFYSENKEGYLQNIGYMGQQLDLFLSSLDIGSLWFGIGKTDEPSQSNLDYVIMIAMAKMPREKFRKDMFKSKRKPLEEIWQGESLCSIENIIRFAPSACNTQPWKVYHEDNTLKIYRYKKPGKRGIMPVDKVAYYNRIDMGIFILFLDLCLKEQNIKYERKFFPDSKDNSSEEVLFAEYGIL